MSIDKALSDIQNFNDKLAKVVREINVKKELLLNYYIYLNVLLTIASYYNI